MAAWLAFLKSRCCCRGRKARRRPAHRRGAGGAPGVPPEAAGGHAQCRRPADDAQAARPRRVRARHARGRAHHPRAQVHGHDLRSAQGLRRSAPRTVKRVHVVPRRTVWSIKEARERLESAARRARPASGCSSICSSSSTGPCPTSRARRARARSAPRWRWRARASSRLSQAEPFAPIYMRKREPVRSLAARMLAR